MSFSEELILFYNTENFFPPDPKPIHRLDPTNSGLRNWDERKYQNKLHKMANVFRLIEEKEGVLPMLIGLAEIKDDSVLKDLLSLEPFNENFGFIHYDSMDERGIDVALIYDKSKIEILHSEPIPYTFEMEGEKESYIDTTRDVLFCRVKFRNLVINVFVCHLPSKREHDINLPKRNHILNDMKKRIQELVQERNEAVILCGDFNDNPNEENIKSVQYDENSTVLLTNPFEKCYLEKKYSVFHNKNGLLFDQVILSQDFFNQKSVLNFSEATVFNVKEISNWDKKYIGRPFRTYAGTRYLGGYSDHFPVFVKLINN